MKLEIEVSDLALLELGKDALEAEMKKSLDWLLLRRSFMNLSKAIREEWSESDYNKEVEAIREETWQEYKEELGL